jgi:hypothetical protein
MNTFKPITTVRDAIVSVGYGIGLVFVGIFWAIVLLVHLGLSKVGIIKESDDKAVH